MANEQEIGALPTRALISYVDRYRPALNGKITRAKALINELDDESSVILVERAMEETRKAEALGEEMAYYSRHISGRRNWTADDVPLNDILVSEEINMAAITDTATFDGKVRELIDFSAERFRAQKEASELKKARAEIRIRRLAREAEAEEAIPIPAAREAARPVQFKAADVPKPEIITFDCTWKTWDENKKKLIQFYGQVLKPVPHLPAAQQTIFVSFLDSSLAEEMTVKFMEHPDANWNQCIIFMEEKMAIRHPIIARRLKMMEMSQNETEEAHGYIPRLKLAFRDGEVDKMSIDDLKVLKVATGIRDKKLKEELLKIRNPTMVKIEEAIKIYEEAKSTTEQLTETDATRATYQGRGGGRGRGNYRGRGRGGNGNNTPYDNTKDSNGRFIQLCNCCNGSGHIARDCYTKSKLSYQDCRNNNNPEGAKGHKNKYSGRCPLNTLDFTIPMNEPNKYPPTTGNPALPPPPATPYPPTNPEITRATFPYGVGENVPKSAYIVDMSHWTVPERERWMQQERDHDQARRTDAK